MKNIPFNIPPATGREPEYLAKAIANHKLCGDGPFTKPVSYTHLVEPIRGGTDGARLSFMGLPCPNLGTGGYAFHGPYEHITVEGMEKTVELLCQLVQK